jgi:hypothetical protein
LKSYSREGVQLTLGRPIKYRRPGLDLGSLNRYAARIVHSKICVTDLMKFDSLWIVRSNFCGMDLTRRKVIQLLILTVDGESTVTRSSPSLRCCTRPSTHPMLALGSSKLASAAWEREGDFLPPMEVGSTDAEHRSRPGAELRHHHHRWR